MDAVKLCVEVRPNRCESAVVAIAEAVPCGTSIKDVAGLA